MNTFVWVLCLGAIVATNIVAQTLSPFDALRSTESARSAGLAGAFVAFPGDVTAQIYNPATLPTVEPHTLSLTFTKHVLDINSGVATYATRLRSGYAGAYASVTSYGTFTRTDGLGNALGSFSAGSVALAVSYAK